MTGIKIRNKILILNMLILLIPCSLFSIVSMNYYKESQIERRIKDVQDELNEMANQAINSIEIGNATMQTMLLNNNMEKFITHLIEEPDFSIQDIINFSHTEIRSIERLVNTNPYLHSVRFYIDNDLLEFEPVIYKGKRFSKAESIANPDVKGWYFNEIDTISPAQKATRYPELLAVQVQPYINIRREQIGVIEVAIPMKLMFPQMYKTTEEEVVYFIDQEGRIHQDDYAQVERWKDSHQYIRGSMSSEDNVNIIEIEDETIISGYKYIKNLDGYIVKIRSLKDVYEQIWTLQKLVIINVIILIGIVTILINKSTKIIFQNFYKILDVIQEIQKGNLDITLDDFGKGEIGELGRNIQTMSYNISKLMKEKVAQEIVVKDTEIKALQNQINAHFIYNVLESIKMMAEIEGIFEISDAITYLGKLLRYSMNWKSPKVKVKEELQYIQNYMALLNLRYDYEIDVNISLPDCILEEYIPKMSIQPIVENAIKHAIEEVAEDTTLYIKGKLLEEYFTIEVTDFGAGISREKVDQLKMKILDDTVEQQVSSNGIGLKNVQDRIRLCFGVEDGLEIVSKEGIFTKIIIKIPYTIGGTR